MHFEGEVRTEWLVHEGDDRQMRLLEAFAFVDDQGLRWEAAPGDVIDGASIPRFLWTISGSPFVGDYRRASVLHDVACQRRERPSKDVHRMFYDAMRAEGMSTDDAMKYYTAVRLFGPRWELDAQGRVRTYSARARVRPSLTFAELEAALDTVLEE
jgi:hypothetical protein